MASLRPSSVPPRPVSAALGSMKTVTAPVATHRAVQQESDAARLASIARTVSLCHSLAVAYGIDERSTKETALMASQSSGYSQAMREAIAFSTCGSYIANSIVIAHTEKRSEAMERTRGKAYVDRYVDGWRAAGTPSMWLSAKWKKPRPIASPIRRRVAISPESVDPFRNRRATTNRSRKKDDDDDDGKRQPQPRATESQRHPLQLLPSPQDATAERSEGRQPPGATSRAPPIVPPPNPTTTADGATAATDSATTVTPTRSSRPPRANEVLGDAAAKGRRGT